MANSLVMSVWRGKVWRMHRFSHKVIIISKNLNGFSLANHGRFTKFAKLSPRQTFPLYGNSLATELTYKCNMALYFIYSVILSVAVYSDKGAISGDKIAALINQNKEIFSVPVSDAVVGTLCIFVDL